MGALVNAPFYVVFAGVNGAGKSTFYRSGLWRAPDMPTRMARVNPDEIVREMRGDPASASDVLAAGKEALGRIDKLLSAGRSFNQEMTLSGRVAVKTIARARDLGYRVFVNYIGLSSPELALERIAHRVELGGHDIGAHAVRRRFSTSMANLFRVLDYCEQVTVYDNTVDFACLGMWANGTLAWWGGKPHGNNWLARAMTET